MFSKYLDRMAARSLASNKKKRDALKTSFKAAYQNKFTTPHTETEKIIGDFIKQVDELENALLNKPTATTAIKLESDEQLQPMINEKNKLEEDDVAAWKLYQESFNLASAIIESEGYMSLAPGNLKNQLTTNVREEMILLTRSLKFTTQVVKKEYPNTEEADSLTNDINEIYQEAVTDKAPRAAAIDKRQKWASFALAVSAVVFIAVVATFVSCITMGIAVPFAAVIFSLGFAAFLGGIVSGIEKINLKDEKKTLTAPQSTLHRFHQKAYKHGEEVGVIPPKSNKPKT